MGLAAGGVDLIREHSLASGTYQLGCDALRAKSSVLLGADDVRLSLNIVEYKLLERLGTTLGAFLADVWRYHTICFSLGVLCLNRAIRHISRHFAFQSGVGGGGTGGMRAWTDYMIYSAPNNYNPT